MWKYNLYKNYRKKQNLIAKNWFLKNNFPVQEKYPFILKNKFDWKNNILLQKVTDYIEEQKKYCKEHKISFPIHKYIHHGLSSQAMLFNLLGEITIEKKYKLLSKIFNYSDVSIDSKSELTFEHYDRNVFQEKQQQPTSFDYAILNQKGKNIFIEAKYVETEFGKCSTIESGECDGLNPTENPSLCYLTHKDRNYWELMKKYGLDIAFKNSRICPYAIYYQFYRELLFALEKNGYYVILIDKRNPAFIKNDRGVIPILLNYVPDKIKDIIKVIFIQDIVNILENNNCSWIYDFKEKYGIKNGG